VGTEAKPAGAGLLLVNLGTPTTADVPAVRRYLAQFLSDRRVVELPPLLWQPILHGVILRTRPARSAANYRKIWDGRQGGSPLAAITRAQAEGLAGAFGANVAVRHAMRYGEPSIGQGLAELRQLGCERILLAPLYPQYSSATTGTVLQEAFRLLAGERVLPAVRTLPSYHDHPAYIDALRASLERHLAALDFEPERILLSFHGMPKRAIDRGDPYAAHCRETARLLRLAMGRSEADMPLAFQSRFGPAEWLQPYLLPLVRELAASGVKRIAVMAPGFAADCLETLEEVAMQVRDCFLAGGGSHYAAIPCLNDSAEGMAMLRSILGQQLSGWAG